MRLRLVVALLIGLLIGMALGPPTGWAQGISRRGGGGSSIVVDSDGWITLPGQLPFIISKETLPNGEIRYSFVVRDNGQEKVLAFTDYPS